MRVNDEFHPDHVVSFPTLADVEMPEDVQVPTIESVDAFVYLLDRDSFKPFEDTVKIAAQEMIRSALKVDGRVEISVCLTTDAAKRRPAGSVVLQFWCNPPQPSVVSQRGLDRGLY